MKHGLDTDSEVFFYEREFYVLSNFSAFTLYWKGERFDTSEAAYHWEKFQSVPEIGYEGKESLFQSNIPYVLDSFQESTEKLTQTAKTEFEAFMSIGLERLGLESVQKRLDAGEKISLNLPSTGEKEGIRLNPRS